MVAREVNWLVDAPTVGAHVEVQVRHRAAPAAAEILRVDAREVELALDEPIAAITPGQSLVVYDGERVLGGGIIESAVASSRVPTPASRERPIGFFEKSERIFESTRAR